MKTGRHELWVTSCPVYTVREAARRCEKAERARGKARGENVSGVTGHFPARSTPANLLSAVTRSIEAITFFTLPWSVPSTPRVLSTNTASTLELHTIRSQISQTSLASILSHEAILDIFPTFEFESTITQSYPPAKIYNSIGVSFWASVKDPKPMLLPCDSNEGFSSITERVQVLTSTCVLSQDEVRDENTSWVRPENSHVLLTDPS